MGKIITVYHGSQQIVKKPELSAGKKHNDYGQGFYCTENRELAKEWACPVKNDGYLNAYTIDLTGLDVVHLTGDGYNILNWLAVLLKNRHFDMDSNIGSRAKEYILANFLPDISEADVIIGYRADDSYFSFAEDFVNNMISVRDLSYAMYLGKLGEQLVPVSDKAVAATVFKEYESVPYEEYFYKREERDRMARQAYKTRKKSLEMLKEDVFVMDIIREGMTDGDARLRPDVSE